VKRGWKLPPKDRVPINRAALIPGTRAKGKKRNNGKPGRPPLEFDPNVIRALAMRECTLAEMAAILGCSERTLSDKYRDQILKGRMEGNISLRRKQYDMAMDGNVTMLIWLGKNRLGQKDTSDIRLGGPDGQPLRAPDFNIVFKNEFMGLDGKIKMLPLPMIEENPFKDVPGEKPAIEVEAEKEPETAPAGD
jgi:hypothetical protein